jgi:predicted CXXCH cytochrome family protein
MLNLNMHLPGASSRSRRTYRFAPGNLCYLTLALFVLGAGSWFTLAAEAKKAAGPPIAKIKKNNLAPLPSGEKALASHGPFEDGDCSICHQNKDPQNPGPLTGPANDQCLGCHEEYSKVLARTSSHVAAKESCVSCHNPHNTKLPKLLVEDIGTLCISCHTEIKSLMASATVAHGVMNTDAKCLNCHDSHGANVEHLLTALPFDLCIKCHSTDDVKDHENKPLTNFKTLLADNPQHHGPISSKDCSACHNPHGSGHFRLLSFDYPSQFYSPYDAKLYALCFECHEESSFSAAETTSLTKFRDGSRNLHYLHVNKSERGRTCRACHEVHASKQPHQMRDAVPYGAKGWMLKINFTPTPTGGSCAKTCHAAKSYTNTVVANPAPSK